MTERVVPPIQGEPDMRLRDLDEDEVIRDRDRAFTASEPWEIRTRMVHDLSTALYGDSWARTESPREVWEAMLREVRQLVLGGRP